MEHPRWRQLTEMTNFVESEDDLDRILEMATVPQIVAAWLDYGTRDHSRDDDSEEDPAWWAVSLMFEDEVFHRDDLYREILVALVDPATDDQLGAIAAGPRENFISDNEQDLLWLEAQAARDPKWRAAILGTWVAEFVSPMTLERLDTAAGAQLPRPRPREEWPAEVVANDEARERLEAIAGPEWYLIENPSPEQQAAIDEFLATMHSMLDLFPSD